MTKSLLRSLPPIHELLEMPEARELAARTSHEYARERLRGAVEAIREDIAARVGFDIAGNREQSLLKAIGSFEGIARLRSTHVGGFVLSAQPLGNFLPIEQTTMANLFPRKGLAVVSIDRPRRASSLIALLHFGDTFRTCAASAAKQCLAASNSIGSIDHAA